MLWMIPASCIRHIIMAIERTQSYMTLAAKVNCEVIDTIYSDLAKKSMAIVFVVTEKL